MIVDEQGRPPVSNSEVVHGVLWDRRPGVGVATREGRRQSTGWSVVLITLKLEPTLMVPEMSGTQASGINSLSDHA